MLQQPLRVDPTDHIFGMVYDELKRIAAVQMARERRDHTLSATALVSEAYLRLAERQGASRWENRGHFFAIAAESMRRILVERARAKSAAKRKHLRQAVDLDALSGGESDDIDLILDLHALLQRLASEDPAAAEFVKLRLFAGLSIVEAGKVQGLSRSSAYRMWNYARAWFIAADMRDRAR